MTRILKMPCRGAAVKQLQKKLKALGYAVNPDGIFGLNTRKAVIAFQEANDIKADGIVGHFTEMALFDAVNQPKAPPASEHFCLDDFISSVDADAVKHGIPERYWDNIQTVMDRLEVVRKSIGDTDIVIRSGYRSPKYNRRVGGARASQHLYGKAVDVYVKGRVMPCSDLANQIYFNEDLRPLFGGYGLGSDTNVHLDIRERKDAGKPVVWWYGKKSWKEWER